MVEADTPSCVAIRLTSTCLSLATTSRSALMRAYRFTHRPPSPPAAARRWTQHRSGSAHKCSLEVFSTMFARASFERRGPPCGGAGPQRDTRRKTPREEAVVSRLMAAGVVALLATTAACSGGSGGSGSAGSDEKVTLTYGLWDKNQVPGMEKIATEFKATHPNVSVSVQVTPFDSYWTKLQAAATGGEAPDVFWMNGPNFQLYASNGVLMPDLKIDSSAYPAALVKLYQYNGKQFGVPKDFDTIGLWYNKKILDAAGVKHPTADWTWADVRSAAKKATNPSKGIHGLGANPSGQEN